MMRPQLSRATVTATQAVLVIGVLIVTGIAYLFEKFLGFSEPLRLEAAGAASLAALLPALWLGYFYSQNRRESTPLAFVGRTAILGAFVAGPLAALLISVTAANRDLVGPALSPLAPLEIARQVLVFSLAHEALKYLVLSTSVGASGHLDRPMAGLIYATSAGLGFGGFVGYAVLTGGSSTITLAGASAAVATVLFIEVSGAAIIGTALGRFRERDLNGGTLVIATVATVVAAAIASTVLRVAAAVTNAGPGEPQSWRALLVVAAGAAIVFTALIAATRRRPSDA